MPSMCSLLGCCVLFELEFKAKLPHVVLLLVHVRAVHMLLLQVPCQATPWP